jgi:predicted  nucleic acid-binding Zn ribbon protein
MFVCEYDFFPDLDKTVVADLVNRELSSFIGDLYRSGQIVRDPWNVVELEDRVRLSCIIPAEDALDSRYYSRYAHRDLEQLLLKSRRPPAYRVLGKALGLPECCECKEPSSYVLFTTMLDDQPPVECGDCGRAIPLYRIPLLEGEEEHSAIRRWAGTYQACDTLFMGSGVGERFGYRQMARFDSPLTREGREICRTMSERTGRPWYYYLTKYYSAQSKLCPGCGSEWELDEPLFRLYHYKCDDCQLLSTEPCCA